MPLFLGYSLKTIAEDVFKTIAEEILSFLGYRSLYLQIWAAAAHFEKTRKIVKNQWVPSKSVDNYFVKLYIGTYMFICVDFEF